MSKNTQLSIEYSQPASPESIAAFRDLLSGLPKAMADQDIDKDYFGPNPDGGMRFSYAENEGYGYAEEFAGQINVASKDGPQFSAHQYSYTGDPAGGFYIPEWAKEVTFTEDGGALVAEAQYGRDENGRKAEIGKDTHPASEQDLAELTEFVSNMPNAIKAFSERVASRKGETEKRLAELAKRHDSRRAKMGRFLRRAGVIRKI